MINACFLNFARWSEGFDCCGHVCKGSFTVELGSRSLFLDKLGLGTEETVQRVVRLELLILASSFTSWSGFPRRITELALRWFIHLRLRVCPWHRLDSLQCRLLLDFLDIGLRDLARVHVEHQLVRSLVVVGRVGTGNLETLGLGFLGLSLLFE